ncbi:hypothetical protein [Chryseobacterium sp. Bi04]|uniref:hypothetical protein n=1 Tax=Chryseobacterium sp. Bi04 TaxID=2822345 RepID=UPI001DF03484|nr:hypothetical protein [Chryseobacterium sp. Bi04]CAH0168734.1 hypothetical protein SRABI04_01200 [Chryseobacterium sp. Bi04]
MSKRKFILLSILKTWFFATFISVVFLIVFLGITREIIEEPRNCDMSGLAYGFIIFWLFFLSLTSLSSLFSFLKQFQGKIQVALCWFLLPVIASASSFFFILDREIDGQEIMVFLIINLPWLALWLLYYYRFNSLFR